jgi:hypothetical protein
VARFGYWGQWKVKERETRTRVKCWVKFPNALYQPQARVEGRDTKAPLGIIAGGRKEGRKEPCGVSTGFTQMPAWMKTRITSAFS